MQRRGDLMIGVWKFYEPQVSVEELAAFGEELAKDDDFVHLYVRKTSTDQIGLGYTYKYSGTKEDCNRIKKEHEQLVKDRFKSGYVGWDMAAWSVVIKGF